MNPTPVPKRRALLIAPAEGCFMAVAMHDFLRSDAGGAWEACETELLPARERRRALDDFFLRARDCGTDYILILFAGEFTSCGDDSILTLCAGEHVRLSEIKSAASFCAAMLMCDAGLDAGREPLRAPVSRSTRSECRAAYDGALASLPPGMFVVAASDSCHSGDVSPCSYFAALLRAAASCCDVMPVPQASPVVFGAAYLHTLARGDIAQLSSSQQPCMSGYSRSAQPPLAVG